MLPVHKGGVLTDLNHFENCNFLGYCAACSGNLILIYWLTAIGLTPGGSSTVHIYTQHREQHS